MQRQIHVTLLTSDWSSLGLSLNQNKSCSGAEAMWSQLQMKPEKNQSTFLCQKTQSVFKLKLNLPEEKAKAALCNRALEIKNLPQSH